MQPGRVFATYLVVYGTGRFLLELTRGDASRGFVVEGLLSTSQTIGLAMIVTGIVLHVWVGKRAAS